MSSQISLALHQHTEFNLSITTHNKYYPSLDSRSRKKYPYPVQQPSGSFRWRNYHVTSTCLHLQNETYTSACPDPFSIFSGTRDTLVSEREMAETKFHQLPNEGGGKEVHLTGVPALSTLRRSDLTRPTLTGNSREIPWEPALRGGQKGYGSRRGKS